MLPPLTMFGGLLLLALGGSFFYKFCQASFIGKVSYWTGLEQFGWLFAPLTTLVTPLLCHTPPSDKTLIRAKTAAWVQLFWGPIFFLLSIMFMTAGADFVGGAVSKGEARPGSQAMNWLLTFGRPTEQAIVYVPPFGYKFPILKKVRKIVFTFLTLELPVDKSKEFEQTRKGRSYTGSLKDLTGDEEDDEATPATTTR